MKTVMIIPAKGNSTRLPHKNLRPFCGHPLFAWSVVQGVNAKCVDEVWVSTDSEEIADVARYYGAQVMMRDYVDEEHTGGYVPVWEFLRRRLESGDIAMDDIVMCRLCTTPGLLPDDIDNMYAQFLDFRERFGCGGMGVGCERRTMDLNRKVVPGIHRRIDKDTRSENNYAVVESLAFMSIQYVYNTIEPTAEVKEQRGKDSYYAGEHPHSYYYNFQPWQWHDVDTLQEFEIAELETEYFLLKGRDMLEVYQQ